jgi:transposase
MGNAARLSLNSARFLSSRWGPPQTTRVAHFGRLPVSVATAHRFVACWRWRWFWMVVYAARLPRRPPGRPAFLTDQQMAELYELVVKGPDPAVDKSVRWRCVDLREVVKRRFAVEVHESTIGKWLHELGLTRLQPRPVHPKKDPEAETAFKKIRQPGDSGAARNHGRDADRDLVSG